MKNKNYIPVLILLKLIIIFTIGCKKYDSDPYLKTLSIDSVNGLSAICKSELIYSPSKVIQRGICWGIESNPTLLLNNYTVDTILQGFLYSKISVKSFDVNYFVRSYIRTKDGIFYGNSLLFKSGKGDINLLVCDSTISYGDISPNLEVKNAGFSILYKGGDGGPFSSMTFNSKGAQGLTAYIDSNNFNVGDGRLNFKISGKTDGINNTAIFEVTVCGKQCNVTYKISNAKVTEIVCYNCIDAPKIPQQVPISKGQINLQLQYENGNGGFYNDFKFYSTGVNGIVAQINKGQLNYNNSGFIDLIISGTPDRIGQAIFNLSIFGQSCLVYIDVVSLTVGQNYKGGIIGYILQPGDNGYSSVTDHGFIVAESDILKEGSGSGLSWGCSSIDVYTSDELGAGSANTDSIVKNCTGNNAARYCYDLKRNGFDDWFLPSTNELMKILQSVGTPSRNILLGMGAQFWTSSQTSIDNATYTLPPYIEPGGFSGPGPKFVLRGVIPIRSF
jgi:hypothetical protein